MKPTRHAHLEADVLGEVVVEAAAELDRLDDGGEVVVGEDHRRGLLGDLGAGDPHRDADVGLLQRGRVVDAVAGHRDDVALPLERCRPGGPCARASTRAITPIVVDLRRRASSSRHRPNSAPVIAAPVMPSSRAIAAAVTAWSPVIIRTWMPAVVGGRDRRLRRRARRVDDPDQGEQRQPVEQREQVGGRVEAVRVEVLAARSPSPAGPARRAARSRPGTAAGTRRRPARSSRRRGRAATQPAPAADPARP